MPDKPADNALLFTARNNAVLTLTMNRPQQRNALSESLMAALQAALDAAGHDPTVRVVIIAAAGPAFSAGHDLKEMTPHWNDGDRGRQYFDKLLKQCARLMQTIVRLPKPVIAEVQGIATAAGCQLVASCDLAVAADSARFATPGVNIGLFCSTPMVALSRNVARKEAMEMLLTGDMIPAARAREIGLVNRVVPAAALSAETMKLAQHIASKSGVSIRIGKEAFYRQLELGLSDAYAFASEVMTQNMLEADAEEGICAFIDKREPKWRS
ncbi:MAG: enoyl-CoA hydratase [Alphaproteobacteria bacterium]|nr:enoyl-CoA hydratase [Alphaproteobacteria bacterium]